MKALRFIEGPVPKGFKSVGSGWLFNTPLHRNLQSNQGWISYHLAADEKKQIVASVHFHVDDDTASTPAQAPFGGVESSPKLNASDLFDFFQQIEINLIKKGVRRIQIKNPPKAYQPEGLAVSDVILLNLGYKIIHAEINTSLTVDGNAFEKKIASWELRKLKQGKKAGLRFTELPISSLAEIYEFLLACREERKQSLSMNPEALSKTVAACKGSFYVFGIYQKKELLAASIGVKINENIFYNFYSGHPRKYDSVSPVVSLIEGMYTWCSEHKISLLDLGTSALEDIPNFGLLEFKLRLGGEVSSKFTFEKDLT